MGLTQTRKEKLYDRLQNMNVEENLIIALCNYFDSSELEGFVDFLKEEGY